MLLALTALSILALILLTDHDNKRDSRPLGNIVFRDQHGCLTGTSPQL